MYLICSDLSTYQNICVICVICCHVCDTHHVMCCDLRRELCYVWCSASQLCCCAAAMTRIESSRVRHVMWSCCDVKLYVYILHIYIHICTLYRTCSCHRCSYASHLTASHHTPSHFTASDGVKQCLTSHCFTSAMHHTSLLHITLHVTQS